MGEDDLGDAAPPHCIPNQRRSHEDLERYSSELTTESKTKCILITYIRATDVTVRLRRIPVGFYVAVKSENETKRTSNKPVSVGRDIVEWEDDIVLPSDRSSRISLTMFASFELGPTLGDGEDLGTFESSVGELLDRNGQLKLDRFLEQRNGKLTSSSSLEIRIKQRVYDRGEYKCATPLNPPESEEMCRLRELTDRGHHALIRYRELEEQEDLDESVRHFKHARDLCPLDHPDRATVLFNLASAKLIHCRVNDMDMSPDIDVPINLYWTVLRLRPRGHPDHALTLLSLGVALGARFQRQDDEADEVDGRILLSQVLDVAPADSYAYHAAILALGSTAGPELIEPTTIQTIDDPGNDGQIQRLDAAMQWMFFPDSYRRPLVDPLGILFCIRFDHLVHLGDPEGKISVLGDVVEFTSDTHPDKPVWLGDLGSSLLSRYDRFGDTIDLEKSFSTIEDGVRLTPDSHPDKPSQLSNLGNSLLTRYKRFGDIVDLGKSISIFQDVVQLTPDGHPNKPLWLNNLGNSLSTRYQRFGDIADLEKSISMFEDVVRLTTNDDLAKPSHLHNLGLSLTIRYQRFGDIADLEKSISMFEDAVRSTPDGHSNKPSLLKNLGNSLLTRYRRFGDIIDLKKSIATSEDVVRFTPDDHPDKPSSLNDLGISFLTRYERFRDIVDLEKSISMFEDALRLTPDGHPAKPPWLNNLGRSLLARYKRFGDIVDLEKSISVSEDAVRLIPDDHPDKPSSLNNLSILFSTRYERFGDIVDLEKPISMKEQAVQLTPDGHPGKPYLLNSLTRSFVEHFLHSGKSSSSDLSQAILYSSRAARSNTGSFFDRFRASRLWGHCIRMLRDDSQSLLDPYAIIVDLLPQLPWIGLSLSDRYHQLLGAAEEICNAAAAALEGNRPELAVEWLEQGRSIIWSQLSQLRTPVDDLRALYPELATRFEHVSHELEHASAQDGTAVNGSMNRSNVIGGPLEKQARQHHTLALSREKLLTEIRALPGFERFLLPKTIEQLSRLAHSGPVVFLNASKYRCDALVVTAGSERVIHVPLSNTNYDEVTGMQLQLNKLLRLDGRVILRDHSDRGARLQGMSPDDVFRSILPYLWDKVVSPILDVLSLSPMLGPGLPRIFWCPTGPFTFLPIHAAGIYSTANSGLKLSDFAISSYIPSMSALELSPQGGSEATSHSIRLLAVPQPSTDGQVRLGGVPREIEAIRELASLLPFVAFQEADGTVEDVLGKMKETDWVHFACHATQDRTNPFDTGLLLADARRLKLTDIVRLSHPHGGLAFLSACQTAAGDAQLSEEAIHIAAGMLLAGYRGVIATMWSIMDSDAPRVTEDVYKSLFQDGRVPDSRQAAEALHHAVERLRDSGVSFLSWVPFIHVGL